MADFPPLYVPGIHVVTDAELEQIAVTAYPQSVRRSTLFAQFCLWRDELRTRGAVGKCWLDGSFLTEKPEPDDIDLVAFPTWPADPTPEVQLEIASLFDKPLVKARFGLDVFVVKPGQLQEIELTSYWRGWFGFCRDGVTAKGIAEIAL